MATNRIKLKKSSVAGKVPVDSDLEYGEVALNFADGRLYYKTSTNQIDFFRSDSDLGGSGSLDSAQVNELVDAKIQVLDIADIVGSTGNVGEYLKSLGNGNAEWASIAGSLGGVDSATAISLAQENSLDSAEAIALIDSAYVQARQITYDVQATIDSSYGSVATDFLPRLDSTYDLGSPTKKWKDLYLSGSSIYLGNWILKEGPNGMLVVDSSGTQYQIPVVGDNVSSFVNDANYLDSTTAQNLITVTYIRDAQDYSYSSLTGAPNVLDSADVTGLIDSTYIQSKQLTYDFLDSSEVLLLVDSSYVQSRQITYSVLDSANVKNIFSGGTGVTYNSSTGEISIGQEVDSSADLVLAGLTTTGNVIIGGTLQVTGTTTTVDTESLKVTDNMIYLNAGESAGSPTASIDIGFSGNYNDDGVYRHTGFFRDATDNTYKVYEGYLPEPDASLQIDTNDSTFSLAPLAARTLTGKYLGFDSDKTAAGLATQTYVDDAVAGLPDSAQVLGLIDSSHVQARQDFAYSSLTGTPTVLDSANVSAIVDSAYVQARQLTYDFLDSAEVISLIDSAYINARVTASAGTDSATVISLVYANAIDSARTIGLIDSAYVQARQLTYDFLDSAEAISLIDSDYVIARQLKSHAIGGSYRFDTSTTAGDPGSGDIRFSIDWTTGTEGSSYYAYVSETDKNGLGLAPLLDQLTVSTNTNKALVILYKADNPTRNAKFYVTGQTDNGSYRTLDITYIDRDAWGQVSNGDEIFMAISLIGDKGDTSSSIDSAGVLSLIDSAYVQARQSSGGLGAISFANFAVSGQDTVIADDSADTLTFVAGTNITITTNASTDTITINSTASGGTDSAAVISIIDSAYVQARQLTYDFLDSSETIALIDSAYVQARQDFAYNSLTGRPFLVDSEEVFNLIDSAYIQARQLTNFLDSSTTISLIDSDYVADRRWGTYLFDSDTTYVVTVASKTPTHAYYGVGSSSAYFIDGKEAPFIELVPGQTYTFDQSDATNSSHPLRFYYDADKTTEFTSGVTVTGTEGNSGAKVEIVVDDDTPSRLYYQCSNHSYMGWAVAAQTHNLTGLTTDDLTEGSTNQYFTTARARSAFSQGTGVTISSGQISIGQTVGTTDNVTFNNLILNGNLTVNGTTTTVDTETIKLADNIIELNSNVGGSNPPSQNAGIEINRGSENAVQLRWNETTDAWEAATLDSDGGTPAYYRLLTTLDSNFSASTLGGESGGYYLNFDNLANRPTSILDLGILDGNAGQALITDGSGNFSFSTISGGSGGGVSGQTQVTRFDANATGSAAFTTAAGTYSTVQVYVNGILAKDSDDYSFNDSSGVVTFTTAPETNSEVSIYGYKTSTLTVDSSGNASITGDIAFGNHGNMSSATRTLNVQAESFVDTFDMTTVRGAKYVITVENDSDRYQISEILLIQDGLTASVTTYGTINKGGGGNLATFDADIDSGNSLVRLLATPTTVNTTYKVVRTDMLI